MQEKGNDLFKKHRISGFPIVAHPKGIQLVSMRIQVQSLASLCGWGNQHCPELWCMPQTWLETCIAVAVAYASSCGSDSSPSLELPYATGVALKRKYIHTYIHIYIK